MRGVHRTTHTRRIIDENRWRAKRDGVGATFIDERSSRLTSVPGMLADLLDLLGPRLDRLECIEALAPLQRILEFGSSAHEQLRIYDARRAAGQSHDEALGDVLLWLASETVGFGSVSELDGNSARTHASTI